MSFAHTMGEFGVVLMVGGNIPGVTRPGLVGVGTNDSSVTVRHAGSKGPPCAPDARQRPSKPGLFLSLPTVAGPGAAAGEGRTGWVGPFPAQIA